jgi:hypothetical protein
MASSDKIFSLEGKGLKLDTAEDLEPHIAPLRSADVEEVRILGNTLGVGACKLLGEVLATKKNLRVRQTSPFPGCYNLPTHFSPGRKLRRYLHRPTPERDP